MSAVQKRVRNYYLFIVAFLHYILCSSSLHFHTFKSLQVAVADMLGFYTPRDRWKNQLCPMSDLEGKGSNATDTLSRILFYSFFFVPYPRCRKVTSVMLNFEHK